MIRAMQNVSIQKAGELPQRVKSAVEELLSRSIDAEQEVSIVALSPQKVPPSANRAAVAQQLEAFLNRSAERLKTSPMMRPSIMCGTTAD